MRRGFYIILFICIFSLTATAQSLPGNHSILYTKETGFGVIAHTRGMGLNLQLTRHQTVKHYRLYDFTLYTVRHPKELRQPNPNISESRPYSFGKKNALVVLKGNYGGQRVLADRNTQQAVRVNFNYSFGPILGLVKPIYYDVRVHNDTSEVDFRSKLFEEENLLDQQNTLGMSSALKGLGKSYLLYGLNTKLSFSFLWGAFDYKYIGLESGVTIDAFPVDVPIFAYIDNQKMFVNLFLTLTYGTRR